MGEVLWIALGAIGGLALLLFALMDTTKREDRKARRIERHVNPFSDVTITRR